METLAKTKDEKNLELWEQPSQSLVKNWLEEEGIRNIEDISLLKRDYLDTKEIGFVMISCKASKKA